MRHTIDLTLTLTDQEALNLLHGIRRGKSACHGTGESECLIREALDKVECVLRCKLSGLQIEESGK